MTPLEFLDRVVVPNVDEFASNVGDERRAYNAIASVDALVAHFFVWANRTGHPIASGVKDDSEFRDRLAARNPSVALIRDAAKAQKHVELTRGKPALSSADQVGAKAPVWGEAEWGEFRWDVPQIVIAVSAGGVESVEATLRRTVDFLASEMRAAGLS